MSNAFRHVTVEARGDLRCVRLRHTRFEEPQIDDLANELLAAGNEAGCSRIALSLGPKPPDCMYSIFLGKLISIQRRLRDNGRHLLLCDIGPEVHAIFNACKLLEHFNFVADFDAAEKWSPSTP